jgi:hypothetical protein
MEIFERLKQNYHKVLQDVKDAAESVSRSPEEIKIVIITKTVDSRIINLLARLGVKDIGESRVQDALAKSRLTEHPFRWHLVGHLQTNKIKKALSLFEVIHSIDRPKLALELQKALQKEGKKMDGFIEVNVSAEESKFGVRPEEAKDLLELIKDSCKNIHVLGLMTMAPLVKDPEDARVYFRRLRELKESLGLKSLSMGMSQDYKVAVEEGADFLRIGSAFFEGVM